MMQIAIFFQTGVPPAGNDESLEVLAFVEAADRSATRGGVPVAISEITN
jgi:hypothetical protein